MSQATILIAEDDSNLSEILKTNLVSLGYNVLAAHDGEEAEKLIFANNPDLSLLDIMMPKKSGIEVLEAMKNNPATKDLAAMMLSNLGQKSDLDKCKALGAKDYLVKANVSLSDIVKKIDEYLKANPPKEKPAQAVAQAATPAQNGTPATTTATTTPTQATAKPEEKIQPASIIKTAEQPAQNVGAIANGASTNGNGNAPQPIQTPSTSTMAAAPRTVIQQPMQIPAQQFAPQQLQFMPQMPPQMQQMPMAGSAAPMLVQMPPMYPAQYPAPQYYMLVPVQFMPQFPQITQMPPTQIPQLYPATQNNGNQNHNSH